MHLAPGSQAGMGQKPEPARTSLATCLELSVEWTGSKRCLLAALSWMQQQVRNHIHLLSLTLTIRQVHLPSCCARCMHCCLVVTDVQADCLLLFNSGKCCYNDSLCHSQQHHCKCNIHFYVVGTYTCMHRLGNTCCSTWQCCAPCQKGCALLTSA